MSRKTLTVIFVLALALVMVVPAFAGAGGRPESGVVVYVTGQDKYYDSIVTTDLPPGKGPFQELRMTADGLETDFGPGDPEYVGGRWWVDVNGNHEMDGDDMYFSCPLLGPGRDAP